MWPQTHNKLRRTTSWLVLRVMVHANDLELALHGQINDCKSICFTCITARYQRNKSSQIVYLNLGVWLDKHICACRLVHIGNGFPTLNCSPVFTILANRDRWIKIVWLAILEIKLDLKYKLRLWAIKSQSNN